MFKKILGGLAITVIIAALIVPSIIKGTEDAKVFHSTYKTVALQDIDQEAILASTMDDEYLYFQTEEGMFKIGLSSAEHLIPSLKMAGKMNNSKIETAPSFNLGSLIWNIVSILFGILLIHTIISIFKFFKDIKKGPERRNRPGEQDDEREQERNEMPPRGNGFGMGNPFANRENTLKINTTIPDVGISDVQGIDTIMEDVMAVIDGLKNPSAYNAIGAKLSKGVVLYGPPGTGKTLLAKAIAGTAGVPFLSVSGSDFVEKYVGVGASRVRELYSIAKKKAPCIVFIDEIDAIGGSRGNDSNSERDQTINALLTELDGFDGTNGVITICATNRLDMLDPALIRAGRFDLKLAIPNPDLKAREAILRKHAEGKNFSLSVDMNVIAKKTVGFSGAELATLLNSAALNAVRSGRQVIIMDDVEDAFFRIVMNGSKKDNDNAETLKLVAWHEAGHALAIKLLTDDGVSSVTITGSTSGAGGVTFRQPKEGVIYSKKYLKNVVKCMYGGRAAEKILLQDDDLVTIGASQDIHQASGVIKDYLSRYGYGENSMLDLSVFGKEVDIIKEARNMASECYEDVLKLLNENKATLKAIADALIEKESLDEAELDEIIRKNKLMTSETI